jgi:hypothetical protein
MAAGWSVHADGAIPVMLALPLVNKSIRSFAQLPAFPVSIPYGQVLVAGPAR